MNSLFSGTLKSRISSSILNEKKRFYCTLNNILEIMNSENLELPSLKVSRKTVAVEVIGSGAPAAPTSVFIHSGEGSYLFNCGEGTQRICVEFKKKISKAQHIFITYPSWKNIGGLLGTSLTLQSTSLSKFSVFGCSKIKTLYYASKNIVKLKKIRPDIKECTPGDKFSDKWISVKYVHLTKFPSDNLKKNLSESKLTSSSSDSQEESKEHSENECFESDDGSDCVPSRYGYKLKRQKKRSRSEAPKKRKCEDLDFALSYICTTSKTQGSLLIDKCVELNIPKGPLLGKLKMGEDITLEDGRVIRSQDVITPSIPGVVIIVVECPTEAYLDSLLKEPEFYKHQTSVGSPEDIASVVVHFTSSEVVRNPKYQEWINRFPKTTKHLYVNDRNKSLGLSSVYRQQYKLNILLPELFPLLKLKPYPPLFSKGGSSSGISERHSLVKIDEEHSEFIESGLCQSTPCLQKAYFLCNGNNHIKGESLTFLPITPKTNYDYSFGSTFDQKYFVEEALNSDGFMEGYEMFRGELKLLEEKIKAKGPEYPKIVFLGTGSSQPNKRRNSSGILIFLSKTRCILLDCGEGTFSQLVRLFGREQAEEILMNLRGVYVSHMHVDHHLGLFTIIQEREQALQKYRALNLEKDCKSSPSPFSEAKDDENERKLFVLAPSTINNWFKIFNKHFEHFMDFIDIVPNSELLTPKCSEKMKKLMMSSDIKSIRTTHVDHCLESYGVMLEHKDGWKITYSGDTKPSQNLINLGKNCDVLIHEATMDDSMYDDARRKNHSTSSQAIEVGRKMNAKFTILTHFSQRYAHIPLLQKDLEDNVGVAFDNLVISLNQLPYISKLKCHLKELYAEEYLKLEEKMKANKLLRKRESSTLLEYITETSNEEQKILIQ